MPTVKALREYPLKGARGRIRAFLPFDCVVGIRGDRQFAIKRNSSVPNKWSPKGLFRVGMNTPQMVAEQPIIYEPKGEARYLEPAYLEKLRQTLGNTGKLSVADTDSLFNMTDTQGAFVSFLNLASVRALSDFLDEEVDPARFRMNVWFDGVEAFEELKWADTYPGRRVINIGGTRFRIDDACERCKAPNANPKTGVYDLPIFDNENGALAKLLKKRGYPGSPHRKKFEVMGFLASPLERGTLSLGQSIQM